MLLNTTKYHGSSKSLKILLGLALIGISVFFSLEVLSARAQQIIEVRPNHGPPGTTVTIWGWEFSEGGVAVFLELEPPSEDEIIQLAMLDLDQYGYFTTTFTVPDIPLKVYSIGARDENGLEAYVNFEVNLIEPAPKASFTESAHVVTEGTTIYFDASTSYDQDGPPIYTYEWDFDGDGIYDLLAHDDPSASYTYMVPGTYTVTLRVTDFDGLTDTATAEKTILPRFVIPEFPFGTFTALLMMIGGLGLWIILLPHTRLARFARRN